MSELYLSMPDGIGFTPPLSFGGVYIEIGLNDMLRRVQNSDFTSVCLGVLLHPLRHGHVIYSSLLRVKTIPTDQHKSFPQDHPI